MNSLQRLLEYCEKSAQAADARITKAETIEDKNTYKGAMLAYITVIAQIRKEMKNENSGGN